MEFQRNFGPIVLSTPALLPANHLVPFGNSLSRPQLLLLFFAYVSVSTVRVQVQNYKFTLKSIK